MPPQHQRRPNATKRFKQGVYVPRNPGKCAVKQCIYRSSYELDFMIWCDTSSNIVEWRAEGIAITYVNPFDHREHKYYPDAMIKIRLPDDTTVVHLVEIKPFAQTQPPVVSARKRKKTIIHEQASWAINQAKWEAAHRYCSTHGMVFSIITEQQLRRK